MVTSKTPRPEDRERIEKIVAACEWARKEGIPILTGTFGVWYDESERWWKYDEEDCGVCALGATVLTIQAEAPGEIVETCATLLDCEEDWVLGFMNAFDGSRPKPSEEGLRGAAAAREVKHRIFAGIPVNQDGDF